MALLAISGYWESFLFYFNPTHRVEPDQTVSASGQGKRDNRGGAPNPQGHRGPIQVWIARRKFEWEGSQSVPTHCFITATGYTAFRGSISRSRDTSFQRPLDTRRHRVNKIDGGGGPVATGTQHTGPPGHHGHVQCGLNRLTTSGRPEQLAIFTVCRPAA